MNSQIYPCLWFNGQAQEAAKFYCSIFENSTILSELLSEPDRSQAVMAAFMKMKKFDIEELKNA